MILTERQRKIVEEFTGCGVVKACPGSGKTLTVAARVARLLSEWRFSHCGIAVVSFTNVACDEIQGYLSSEYKVETPLPYPHYLGTIDSFINTYIFLPFGHLFMGCDARPELIGPPVDDFEPIGRIIWWPRGRSQCMKGCRLNDFYFDQVSTIHTTNSRNQYGKCDSEHKFCADAKLRLYKGGRATQLDANYIAMRLLEEHTWIASALADRFPALIVDEAQDMSSVQMRVLDLLLAAGLEEVLLLGDPDQAIYEWRTAEPNLFEQKYDSWNSNSTVLNDNWRSTQPICDFASVISSNEQPMKCVNPDLADITELPEFVGYNKVSDILALMNQFCDDCKGLGIAESDRYLLTRGTPLLRELFPNEVATINKYPWKDDDRFTRTIAKAKHLFDSGEYAKALQQLERVAVNLYGAGIAFTTGDRDRIRGEFGFVEWRMMLYDVLLALPEAKGTLAVWVEAAKSVIQDMKKWDQLALSIKQDRGRNKFAQLTFHDVFSDVRRLVDRESYPCCHVHSVKGRTIDAVFLVLKKKAGSSRNYTNLFNTPILEDEELRILYVALTRARKKLTIAVPTGDIKEWREKFNDSQ